jgi:SAM-dependent methyltransferase
MLGRVLSSAENALRRRRLARAAVRSAVAVRRRARAGRQRRAIQHQRQIVVRELDREAVLERFARRQALPSGFGIGANERVVEIPWLLAEQPAGRTLDAGAALNHAEFLRYVQPLVEELHIVNLVYEGTAYVARHISYVFSDLRTLPYRDGYFDTVASISTLEHIGMDNTGYGTAVSRAADPLAETDLAVRELVRVLSPGGKLLITVPYGRREDHGSFRQFDRSDLMRLIEVAEPAEAGVSVYQYSKAGWITSNLDDAAGAQYRLGFAAEAVACVRMTRSS